MRDEDVIDLLAKAVKLAMKVLPDSESFKYCWDEMTDEEQDEVKGVRVQLIGALEVCEVFKKASKGENDDKRN